MSPERISVESMGKKLPDSPSKQFSNIVRLRRHELGLTLQNIQNKCGISRGYLWMIENKKRGIPTIETIMRIEKGMGVKCGVFVKKAVELLKEEVYGKK